MAGASPWQVGFAGGGCRHPVFNLYRGQHGQCSYAGVDTGTGDGKARLQEIDEPGTYPGQRWSGHNDSPQFAGCPFRCCCRNLYWQALGSYYHSRAVDGYPLCHLYRSQVSAPTLHRPCLYGDPSVYVGEALSRGAVHTAFRVHRLSGCRVYLPGYCHPVGGGCRRCPGHLHPGCLL